MGSDPYVTLGIPRDASAEQVRRAYRALAAKWHPDRSPGPEAQERFRRISEAYVVLSDAAKRAAYDAGTAGAAAAPRPGQWFQIHPRKKPGKARMAENFRNAMKPGTVYEVREEAVRIGPVPVVTAPSPAMPEVPLWTKGRRG